jgi:tetratricopeptide (TPR) repeat protein
MKKFLSLSVISLTLGIFVASCTNVQTTAQAVKETQIPTPAPRSVFQPGDPTSVPPGSEITDPDFQAGVAAYKRRDFEQVQALMETVIRRNPQLAPPYWYLGRARYEKGDYESAMQQMNKATAIDPNYALAYADRGMINFALGNENQGVADLQHALELDPSLAKAHHNLGVYYYNKREMDLSLQEYDLALQIDPTRSSSWESRAEVLHVMGRLEDCIQSASHAIDNDNQNWSAYGIRASCYADSGNYEQASADISIALKNSSPDATMIAEACAIMTQMSSNDQAIEYCTKSMALEPSRYESMINRGVAYFNSGSYQEAINDFSSALEFGEIPLAYSNRGNAHMKLNEFQEAVDDYQKSLDLYPNGYVYYSMGFAYTQLQDYEHARSAFEQGDILEPEKASENYRLWGKAQAYDKLDQDDKALELYTQLIDQYQRTEAYYFRGRIYEAKGMKENAMGDYQTFLDLASQVPDDSYIQMLAYDANQRIEELTK